MAKMIILQRISKRGYVKPYGAGEMSMKGELLHEKNRVLALVKRSDLRIKRKMYYTHKKKHYHVAN